MMNLINILKQKYYKKITANYYYEIINNPDNNKFSFENKYANQENKLFKIYGHARKIDKKLKLIVITDTHNTLKEEEFSSFISEHPIYDVCLLLGDFGSRDMPIILKYIDKSKIYALLGNHDYNYINEYKLNNLNGKMITVNDVTILGMQGSFKYKPVDFPSFSQVDSIKFLNKQPSVDILATHDTKFNSNAKNDSSHQGLFGITYYLFKNKVPYHIHGHIHNPYYKKMINGTIEISSFNYEYIEI